jgi:uncharacterized protein (DUF885 family)
LGILARVFGLEFALVQLTVRYIIVIALSVLLLACAEKSSPPLADAQSALFREFLERSYAEDMVQYPATAGRRGIHDNDREWNSLSESFKNQRRALLEERLVALEGFDRTQLSESENLSWRLYQQNLLRSLASDDFRRQKYPISQLRGPHTEVPSYLINIHKVKSITDAENYIARLHSSAVYLDQTIEQMQLAAQAGTFLPDWSYPKIIETINNTLSGTPFDQGPDSAIWADINTKLDRLDLAATQHQELKEAARTAMLESLRPAYQRLKTEIQRQAPLAPAKDGVWKLSNGAAYYAERLNSFTTTDLSADEIHDIGLAEVDRIHGEMRDIMKQVNFEGSLLEFFAFMRESPQFYYADSDEGRERYLSEATVLIEAMRARLPEVFGLLPQASLVVKRVEPFRERSAGLAFYQYPAADGSRPGTYYANLYDMKSMPTYQMAALAYHEGVPGHHMQRAITVELKDIPEFQKYASFTAFTEGWGLYSELLPLEMGFYQDPYSNFGRLSLEIWRACRLVVDTGLHHKRWTREEAIDYLQQNSPHSLYEATKAIERYAINPGQATAYMIGRLKIVELREAAREALGEQFDIRGFHDEVLKDGAVPLYILEEKINRWVERVKAG